MIRLTGLIIGFCLLLSWYAFLAGEAQDLVSPSITLNKSEIQVPTPQDNSGNSTQSEIQFPPLSALRAINEMPLFFQGRAFPKPTPARPVNERTTEVPAAQQAVAPASLTLRGIYFNGEQREALIEGPGGTLQWVRPDDSVAGWRVDKIADQTVTLRTSGRTTAIKLYPDQATD